MGWYRRSSRFIVDALHRYNSKAAAVPLNTFSIRSNSTGLRISKFSPPFLRNSFLQNVIKNNLRNNPSFANGSKRFYFGDRNKVHYFKNKRWSQNSRTLITIGFLVSGVSVPVYFWNLETVPYTERSHFVLLSSYLEKEVGEILFDFLKTEGYEGQILPSHHPESIRVHKIGQDIIGALLKGRRKEEEQSMKKIGVKSQTAHVEEFEWEIIVVNDTSIDNAYCFPGGKIVIFTGMLNHLKSDAEIATIIGHEVGHAVARHSAERMSGILWLLLLQFFMSDVLKTVSNLFLGLPFSRRNEMEADYIGLLLMASAGYDPRVAPQVYYTFEDRSRSLSDDYLSTHPHGKRRAQLLSEPKVMEEALSMYKEALKEEEDDRPMNFFNRFIGFTKFAQLDTVRISEITIGLLGSGFASTVYFWNLETLSFTKRSHFVLLSTYTEKKLGQFLFKLAAEVFEWKILPSHHPHSIRVQRIGQEIIRALHKELKKEEHSMKKMGTVDLEEFEWEFIVVDDPDDVNAELSPAGKIVVFTGLLDYFKTDAEIAATIAHEVGHAAARHSAETMSGILWLMILMFFMPDCVEKMTDRFVWLPYSRRKEIEADYIGMLLMASAGYDPRVAIEVCEKFDRLEPLDEEDYLSTHPSEKKRAQSLSQPKVMEETLSLYRRHSRRRRQRRRRRRRGRRQWEREREIMQWPT